MIFMSQSAIVDATCEAQWDDWYLEHLQVMLTVPGVDSAQRFKTSSPGYPRSLAMYTFASADIFNDPYYLGIRGQGEWVALPARGRPVARSCRPWTSVQGPEPTPEHALEELALAGSEAESSVNAPRSSTPPRG